MTRVYRGRIFTGVGVAKTRVQQNLEIYKQMSGMDLMPGTLNVRLTEDFQVPKQSVYIRSDKIRPAEANRGISLVPATLCGERVVLMCPDHPIYARNVIEIMAPFNLRERFHFKDGDEIEIEV